MPPPPLPLAPEPEPVEAPSVAAWQQLQMVRGSAALALAMWEVLVAAAAGPVAELAAELAVADSPELELGPAVALGLAEDH